MAKIRVGKSRKVCLEEMNLFFNKSGKRAREVVEGVCVDVNVEEVGRGGREEFVP